MHIENDKRKVTYKGKLIRITAAFSAETLKARRVWNDVFQVQKEKNCPPKLLYSAKLSFIIKIQIRTFHNKQKLKQFMITKSAEGAQGILYTKEEDKYNHENRIKNKPHQMNK
jgi:hypothetical protein